MPLSVVGIGIGRTGTLSLKTALEQLGCGPCFHCLTGSYNLIGNAMSLALDRKRVDWNGIFKDYNAAVDVPFSWFYRDIAEHCPSAKFILTVRDPNAWFDSARAVRLASESVDGSVDKDAHEVKLSAVLPSEVVEIMKFQDRESVVAAFERFNAEVQRTIPMDRLLVLNVKQGWKPLCDFLKLPIPSAPFPHLNSIEEFPSLLRDMIEREYPRKSCEGSC